MLCTAVGKQSPQMRFARSYCLLCWDLFASSVGERRFNKYEVVSCVLLVVFISHISKWTCMYNAFLISLSRASQLPRMFRRCPCDKAAVLSAAIKERPCIDHLIRSVEPVGRRVQPGVFSLCFPLRLPNKLLRFLQCRRISAVKSTLLALAFRVIIL